jgi:hypothetical protein
MAIELSEIDPASIPEPLGGNENRRWQDALRQFVESGAEAVEVLSGVDGKKASTGLRGAVRGLNLRGQVKVLRRGDRVFLERLNDT